jgi:sn-glycerol 3-phosphate transport system substrate-binding protein
MFKKWLNGVGVDMVNAGNGREGQATEATFNTPQARELLEQLQAMNDEGLLNPFPETEGGIDQYLAIVTQQSSMLVETSGAATNIVDALSGTLTPEDVGAEFDPSGVDLDQLIPGTAPFPGIEPTGDTLPGGGIFFILNTSEPAQQAASWRFLRFMLETDNVRQWHLRGSYLPVRTSTQDDPQLEQFWEDDLAGALLRTSVDQLQAADPDQPGPLIGPFTDYSDALDEMMEAVLINDADVQSALDRAEERVTEALERYAG